jgi:hypothetical protein
MKWGSHVARMVEIRNLNKILVENPEGPPSGNLAGR